MLNRITHSTRRPTGGGGFSLAELMISVGILGIGLTMAASLFPAALKENQRSANNLVGMVMCDNGLSLAKMVLDDNPARSPRDFDPTNNALVDKTGILNTRLGAGGLQYPFKTTYDSTIYRGFLLLGRRIGGSAQNFQLAAVAYNKAGSSSTISLKTVKCDVRTVGDNKVAITSGVADLRIGSPLICSDSGYFATIIGIDSQTWPPDTYALLDHPLVYSTTQTGLSAFVIQDSGDANYSPVIGVMVIKTGLRSF